MTLVALVNLAALVAIIGAFSAVPAPGGNRNLKGWGWAAVMLTLVATDVALALAVVL